MSKEEKEIILTQAPVESLIERVASAVVIMLEKKLPIFDEKLISGDVACKIFEPNISRQTLSNWTKEGLLKLHRLGGRNYYKQSQIIEAAKEMKFYKKEPGERPALHLISHNEV